MPLARSAFIASTVALGTGLAPSTAFAQTAPLNLRLAANANDTYAAPYYAQDEGFFPRFGLNVDLQTISNGAATGAAMIAGGVDVGIGVPMTVASAHLGNIPFVIVAAGAMSLPTAPALRLCAAKTSAIKTPQDLEGGTIAINSLGNAASFQVHAWLAQNSADFSKVKFAEVPFSEMGTALDHGTVDVALIAEPSYTVALQKYGIRTLIALDRIIGAPYVVSCWFTTREYADTHPEQIARFTRAMYFTQRWANAHQPDSALILSKYSKLDLSIARVMTRCIWADALRASDFQPYFDMAAKYGALARPVLATDLFYKPA